MQLRAVQEAGFLSFAWNKVRDRILVETKRYGLFVKLSHTKMRWDYSSTHPIETRTFRRHALLFHRATAVILSSGRDRNSDAQSGV